MIGFQCYGSCFGQVEAVFVAKELLHRVYLKELRTAAFAHVATQIGNLVVFLQIALLSQHAYGSRKELLAVNVLLPGITP